jgi:hypothetical protein
MQKSCCALAAILLAGVVACSSTRAETITATLGSLTPNVYPTVEVTYNGGANHTQVTGGAGQINWVNGSTSNPTNDSNFTPNFSTYCIDLLQDINFGHQYIYDTAILASGAPQPGAYLDKSGLTSPMGAVRAGDIQKLYDLHFGDTLGTTAASDVNKTAFQLAIWNLIYDVSGVSNVPGQTAPDQFVDSGSGNFFVVSGVSSSVLSTADSWLADVFNLSKIDNHFWNVEALIGENGAQDQVYATLTTGGGQGFAPLPPTVFGGFALLGALAIVRFRQSKSRLVTVNHSI